MIFPSKFLITELHWKRNFKLYRRDQDMIGITLCNGLETLSNGQIVSIDRPHHWPHRWKNEVKVCFFFHGRHQNVIYKIAKNFFISKLAKIFDVVILIELQRCGYLCKLILLWTQLMKWNVNWDFFSFPKYYKYYKSFVLDVWHIYCMNSIHFFHTFKFHKCINIRNPIIRLLFLIVSNAIWLYYLTKKNIFSKNPLIIFYLRSANVLIMFFSFSHFFFFYIFILSSIEHWLSLCTNIPIRWLVSFLGTK